MGHPRRGSAAARARSGLAGRWCECRLSALTPTSASGASETLALGSWREADATYETHTRCSGGRYIRSPGPTAKAAYQGPRFRTSAARHSPGNGPVRLPVRRQAIHMGARRDRGRALEQGVRLAREGGSGGDSGLHSLRDLLQRLWKVSPNTKLSGANLYLHGLASSRGASRSQGLSCAAQAKILSMSHAVARRRAESDRSKLEDI
jgi:hypothetical protein|nr:hypothetical protein [Phenylobacterium sp.]